MVFRGESVPELQEDRVKEGLDSFYDELCMNVERAIPFTNRDKIDKLFISGGGSNAPGLMEYFKDRFESDVEKLNPFNNIKIKEGLFAIDEIEKIAPLLVPSIGLSLRS